MDGSILNDSGFSSPGKCSASGEDDRIIFFIKTKLNGSSTLVTVEIQAQKNASLASAIKEKYPQIKINDRLFWAKICGHAEYKCVNPYLLPCKCIQEETYILFENYTGKIYDNEMTMREFVDPSCTLFFVSMCERKNKVAITHVGHGKLGRDICVVANPGETYEEALLKDGRFKNVDSFLLKRKVEGGEVVVDITEKPYKYGKEVVLQVTAKVTSAQSTDTKPNFTSLNQTSRPTTSESICASDGATVLGQPQTISETPKKKPKRADYDKLGKTLWEKHVVFDFPKDVAELTTTEMLDRMENCLRALAWYTLFGPKDRAAKKFEKSLEGLGKIQFANHNIVARPVLFNKKLCRFYDSVGFIECGDIQATCFLISDCMILTSCHVVNFIANARNSSTHVDYSEVFVYFDYEEPRGTKPLSNGYKLLPLDSPSNVMSNTLDYAFLFLEHEDEENLPKVKPLGKYVTCEVPQQGNLCIVGHPFGNIKQDEFCTILPLHDDGRYREFERRVVEEEKHCRSDPSCCALTSTVRNTKCVHMYRPNIERLCGERKVLTYDVGSLFEGSSGAPVFNMKCEIVALHTAGFRVNKTSILEYGITFQAIMEDLKTLGHSQFVREHFPPSCYGVDEPMQVD